MPRLAQSSDLSRIQEAAQAAPGALVAPPPALSSRPHLPGPAQPPRSLLPLQGDLSVVQDSG